MKWTRTLSISIFAVLFAALGSSVDTTLALSSERGTPTQAEEALTKSQGRVRIITRLVSGGMQIEEGMGFLVDQEGWVVTALHLLPNDIDAAHKIGSVLFNGTPALLEFFDPATDLAVLRIHPVPWGIEPVSFVSEITRGMRVFSQLTGCYMDTEDVENSKGTCFETGLGYEGTVAGIASSITIVDDAPVEKSQIYLDRAMKPGFSGALVVDSEGRGIGMAQNIEGGYSVVLGASTIQAKVKTAQRGYQDRIARGELTHEEMFQFNLQKRVFEQIMWLYAVEALERPSDLRQCAYEMFAMQERGNCRDRFSHYLNPNEARDAMARIEGNYEGIGLELTMQDGRVTVVTAFPGSPAERVGFEPKDMMIEVNGEKVKTLFEAVSRIRGPAGTEVTVGVSRLVDGAPVTLSFTLSREVMSVHPVTSYIFTDAAGSVGVVKIKYFQERIFEEFEKEMRTLIRRGIREVVVDLVNNPGGVLDEVLRIVALFLNENDIAIVFRDRGKEIIHNGKFLQKYFQERGYPPVAFGALRDFKIVLIVNAGSASASEILAGALQEFYPVVGERTFGKGVGQKVFPLADGSQLFLTTFEFLVGNRRTQIRDQGVAPDVTIPTADYEQLLKKAIEVLRTR